MTKLVKISMIGFVLEGLDQEYFMAILQSMNELLETYRNFHLFYML